MSIQVTPRFLRKMDTAEQWIKDAAEETFYQMANDAVDWSPVWSGAYVQSFSFHGNSSSRGRRRKSDSKPSGNPGGEVEVARAALQGDLMRLFAQEDFPPSITLRNDAEHARAVETGVPPARQAYGVFSSLRAKYN